MKKKITWSQKQVWYLSIIVMLFQIKRSRTMVVVQCCISAVPPLTHWHSKLQVFQQTRGEQNFSKPFKKHHIYYWVFRLIFLSWFIWRPLDIPRAFQWTTHMTISSTLKFTNTLPYAWKYHRIDSTELIKKGVLTGSTQQSTWVIMYNSHKIILLYINEMFKLKINNSKPKDWPQIIHNQVCYYEYMIPDVRQNLSVPNF